MVSLILATLLTAAPQAQVQTLAGETLAGEIVAIDDQRVVLATPSGRRELPVTELLLVTLEGAQAESPAKAEVWATLADGSRIAGRRVTAADGKVQIELAAGGTLEAASRDLDSVRFREHDRPLATQWDEIARAERTGDLIVVRKNDALDYLSGVVRGVNDDVVEFELDGEVIPVKRARVDGLFFHGAARKPPAGGRCIVSDPSGSRFQAASLELAGDVLKLRTASGVAIERPLASLARLDFGQGNLQYLGDLRPESETWTPFIGDAALSPAAREFYRMHVDRALEGGALRVGGKEYARGLALHSRSEVVYRLPDRFRKFEAVVGIDDRVRPAGNVRLTVHGDDRMLFDETITGQDDPRALLLDIDGVQRLKIVVDYGEDLDVGDFLNLCEARILK